MADTPKDDDKLPDAEADERFDRALKTALATPHTPHTPHKPQRPKDDVPKPDRSA